MYILNTIIYHRKRVFYIVMTIYCGMNWWTDTMNSYLYVTLGWDGSVRIGTSILWCEDWMRVYVDCYNISWVTCILYHDDCVCICVWSLRRWMNWWTDTLNSYLHLTLVCEGLVRINTSILWCKDWMGVYTDHYTIL